MNILLLGAGGREHALAWKLAQSPAVREVVCGARQSRHRAPCDLRRARCGGSPRGAAVLHPAVDRAGGDRARSAAGRRAGGFACAPPGVPVFGPSRAAAELEGSKGFTKDLCERAGIPTGEYVRAKDAGGSARRARRVPAAGRDQGRRARRGQGRGHRPDPGRGARKLWPTCSPALSAAPGAEVVIEEFLEGEEASFFALTDGATIVPFGSAQDHKRVGEGDTGPNTGGMGAYSPAPVLTPAARGRGDPADHRARRCARWP